MNTSAKRIVAVLLVIGLVGVSAYAVTSHFRAAGQRALIVYSADAYVEETNILLGKFHNSSGVPIAPAKGGGSLTDARELGQGAPGNVFISVSLDSYNKSFLQSRYSGWAIAFAADQMVIAYSRAYNSSNEAKQIVSEFNNASSTGNSSDYATAFSKLTSGSVKVGIADPTSDPAGYRGWIVMEIAGYLYHNNNESYYTERLQQNGGNRSAADAASLVSPLESGQIQFLFIYRSAAVVMGLNYIQLPAKINLGDGSYGSFYSNFSYTLPSGMVYGAPVYLYISALNGSATTQSAMGFTEFVINSTSVLADFGLTPLKPALLYADGNVPEFVDGLLNDGRIVQAGSI